MVSSPAPAKSLTRPFELNVVAAPAVVPETAAVVTIADTKASVLADFDTVGRVRRQYDADFARLTRFAAAGESNRFLKIFNTGDREEDLCRAVYGFALLGGIGGALAGLLTGWVLTETGVLGNGCLGLASAVGAALPPIAGVVGFCGARLPRWLGRNRVDARAVEAAVARFNESTGLTKAAIGLALGDWFKTLDKAQALEPRSYVELERVVAQTEALPAELRERVGYFSDLQSMLLSRTKLTTDDVGTMKSAVDRAPAAERAVLAEAAHTAIRESKRRVDYKADIALYKLTVPAS